ncbi:hypothetical protein MVEN_01196500 [Mycena venus]|uniref:F-box domain-containing protein n=1 Tax=Mycena venus TaxID=2733690 RepID=A0A8H6Y2X8_9AGAR|nr:hypothetical protein MVEN_01196500 [Mycena venus]
MAFSSIPPEICAAICSEVVDSRTLALLCRTSRDFRDEAQRLLYHSVDFRGRLMRAVKSWARAIEKHPHLAERVHTLALRLPDTLTFEVSDATKIGRALAKCVNLKELRIVGDVSATGHIHNCIHGWMINDCPFRLTKFENLYFQDRWIEGFWQKQTEIRVLSIAHSSACFTDQNLLPELIAVRTTSMSDLPEGRALQRVETRFQRDLLPLVQYKGTLTTLNLRRDWMIDLDFSIGVALGAVAELLPDLMHLGIVERFKDYHLSLLDGLSKTTFQQFTSLKTFTLRVLNVDCFVFDNVSPFNMNAAADVHGLAYEIMMACPTLRRVAVGAEGPASVLRRVPGGEIHEESVQLLDFDAFSMFWNS